MFLVGADRDRRLEVLLLHWVRQLAVNPQMIEMFAVLKEVEDKDLHAEVSGMERGRKNSNERGTL